MSGGSLFLLVMSLGYLGAAACYFVEGNNGYALALTCYAIANCGLIWAA